MKAIKYLSILFAGILLFAACQKELSFESGFDGGPSVGSLFSSGGSCKPITIGGYYLKDSTLTDSNYVTVTVNVTNPGPYNIFTEFKNGFSFGDSGFFITTGPQLVKLKAKGKPIALQQTLFTVAYDTSICSFAINVTDTIILPAAYVFDTTGNCTSAIAKGIYKLGVDLNSSNKVDVKIKVFQPGSYSVETDTIAGMWFKASGIVYSSGNQTISFQGYGKPNAQGLKNFPIRNGTSVCKFTINVDTGTVVVPPTTTGDSAWSFNQGASNFFNGPIDTALTATTALGTLLTINGSTAATGDTALTLVIALPGSAIVPGTYKTNVGVLNVFSVTDVSGSTIYSANVSTPTTVMTIVITSYDSATKTVKGTFSGNASNASGASVPITNGKFTAKVN